MLQNSKNYPCNNITTTFINTVIYERKLLLSIFTLDFDLTLSFKVFLKLCCILDYDHFSLFQFPHQFF